MNTRTLFLLLLIIISTEIQAQTPAQSYFDWAEMPFSKEELAERRQKLVNSLKDDGKEGLVVIPAIDGFSYGETFRQADDFYYFTGLELPNSLLVIDLTHNSTFVYVPEGDKRFESVSRPNDFPGMPLLSDASISTQSGLSLKNIADFEGFMAKKYTDGATILVNSGRPGDIIYGSDDYNTSFSPIQQLFRSMQAKHQGLLFANSYEAIAKIRMVKSPAEIAIMRKSTLINVEGIKTAAKAIAAGIDERYLEGVLEGNYKINGRSD